MKRRNLRRIYASLSILSLLLQTISGIFLYSPALAQELTPTPTPVPTITEPAPTAEPTAEPTLAPTAAPTIEPTAEPTAEPTVGISPEVTPKPLPTEEVTPTPTVEENQPTPTNDAPPQENGPPTGEAGPSATTQPSPTQPTPTVTVAAPKEDAHLAAAILKDTAANSITGLDLDFQPEGSATLKTDKLDYAPTDTVLITGTGFLAGKTYTIYITSETGPFSFSNSVTADAEGNLFYSYQLDGTYRPDYKVEVKDGDRIVASTTFTDSRTTSSATLNGGSSTITVFPGAAITAVVNATLTDNNDWHGTAWRISTTAPGSISCEDTPDHDSNGSYSESFSITAPLAAGTYNVYFRISGRNDCGSETGTLLTLTGKVVVAAPTWPTSWTTPTCSTDPTGDIGSGLAEIDLKGDATYPAVGYAADNDFRYFREQINDTAYHNGFKQKAWVALYQTSIPSYQYLVSVNGKNGAGGNEVQLWQNTAPAITLNFNPLLNDPAETKLWGGDINTFARYVDAGGRHYIDWAIPKSVLPAGITDSTAKYFATSSDANNFNQDHLNCYEAPAPVCNNGQIESPEVCDGNSQSCTVPTNGYQGTQSCNASCNGWNSCVATQSCGDGQINGNEVCDDGANNGQYGYCKVDCAGIGDYCGDGIVNGREQCDDGNINNIDACNRQCQFNPVTIKAYKIVCNSEADLPNWSGGANITASTAQAFVDSHPNCHYGNGWDFQWGFADKASVAGVDKLIGTHIGPADGTVSSCANNCGSNTQTGTAYNQWKTFGSTDSNNYGMTQVTISDLEGAPGIWVRENLQTGYVPFTYPPQASPGSDVSAEIYCHHDVEKYDNYDQIVSPQSGQTYYCVAFNALSSGTITVNKQLSPGTDSGRFNLEIGGTTYATNVGNNGSTGAVVLPAGDYDVAEVAGTGTNLSDYSVGVDCLDQANGQTVVDGPRGGMTILRSVNLASNQNIVCTFINTRNPYCGDGVINQTSEQCDGTDDCLADCTLKPVVAIDPAMTRIIDGQACGVGNAWDDDGLKVNVTNWKTGYKLLGRYFIAGGSFNAWADMQTYGTLTVSGTDATLIAMNTGDSPAGPAGWEVKVVDASNNDISNTDSLNYIINSDATSQVCGGVELWWYKVESYKDTNQDATPLAADDTWTATINDISGASAGTVLNTDTSTSDVFNKSAPYNNIKLPHGVYTLSENGKPGYQFSWGRCMDSTDAVPYNSSFYFDVGSAEGKQQVFGPDVAGLTPDDSPWSISTDGFARLNLTAGKRIYCVLYNKQYGSIDGHKYNDLNGNGNQETEEPMVTHSDVPGGVRIFIDSNADGIFNNEETNTYTDDSGYYQFGQLLAGTYDVCEVVPAGWSITSPSNLSELPNCQRINIKAGENVAHDFGNVRFGNIHGYKWNDINGNGQPDCALEDILGDNFISAFLCEPKLSGWTIFIDANRNGQLDNGETSFITSSDPGHFGWYWFENLLPGQYQICEVLQPGWTQSYPVPQCHTITLPDANPGAFAVTANAVTAPEYNFGNQQNPTLTITKANDTAGADRHPGNDVLFTLTVTATQSAVNGAHVYDLPAGGFKYRGGSCTANSTVRGALSCAPVYASPGDWDLGNMADGEVVTLTYIADISGDQDPGLYKDLAWAKGSSLLGDPVMANEAEGNYFVGTEVNVVKEQQSGQDYNVEKQATAIAQVLGASTTNLPATGARALWLVLSLGLLMAGLNLLSLGIFLRRKNA